MGCINNFDGYGCRNNPYGYRRDRYDEFGPRRPYGPRGVFGPCGSGPCHDRRPYPRRPFFNDFPRFY